MSRLLPELTVVFTFFRHGESTDNLSSVWAGWKDAPLSNHGKMQAEALATSFAYKRFTAIHSSPLKRALVTAQTLQDAQPDPKPPLITSSLLREQHFGLAEGQSYAVHREAGLSLADHFAKGKFPPLHNRAQKFPEGESLEDLASRAEQAIEEIAIPYVRNAAREGINEVHVAFVSHGLFIKEAIAALMSRDTSGKHSPPARDHWGLRNTGWARVTIKMMDGEGTGLLQVRLTDHNRCEHLNGLIRQKGGIGSTAFDPKQRDIRAFFGGKTKPER